MSSRQKNISITILALISALLFLGGIVINLIASNIEGPLRTLFGQHYRPFITGACFILAAASGYLAWLQM